MRKLLLLLLLSGACAAAAPPSSTTRTGRWKTAGNVKELYQTPEGTVYRFEPSPHFSDLHRPVYANGKKHADDCTCRTCRVKRNLNALQLPLKKPRKKTDDHFVVISFKARLFPVLGKNLEPDQAALAFYFSENAAPGVDGDSLYQVFRILPGTVLQENLFHRYKAEMQERLYGRFYQPLFDWISVRMIVDISEHICRLYVNGALYQCIDLTQWQSDTPKLSSIGIFVEMGKKRPSTFEITRPELSYLTDGDELDALPPVICEPYDYDPYFQGPRKRTLTPAEMIAVDRDNPDRHYAAGIRIMEDPAADPLTAVKAWRTAARDGHLPARYQLAVCQWRGLGMEPDPDAAIKMLQEMPEYPPAAALAALIEWQRYPIPAMPTRKLLNLTRETFAASNAPRNPLPSPDIDRLRSICAGMPPTLQTLRQRPEISIKQLLRIRPFPVFPRMTRQEIDAFLPCDVPDDRLHTLDDATFFRAVLTRAQHSGMPLVRQWMASWLRQRAIDTGGDKSLLEAAESQLNTPESRSDDACALLRLRIRWERGLLTAAELDTPANRLRFRNDPVFMLLLLAVRYPDTPGLPDLRRGQPLRAMAQWQQDLSPVSRMMTAMVKWETAAGTPPHFGSTVAGQPANRDLWNDAFRQLAEAAADQLPEAETALARLSLEIPDDAVIRPRMCYPASTAIAKLKTAADSGDVSAGLSLANYYRRASGGVTPQKWQPYLLRAAETGNAEACRLLGESLLKTGRRADAVMWLNRAGDAGDPAALSTLARLATGDDAAKAWRRFVEADRKSRMNDPLDFPEPALPINQTILNGIPTWDDFADAMKRRGRVQRYEDWRRWGRQSEGKIGGTSLSF